MPNATLETSRESQETFLSIDGLSAEDVWSRVDIEHRAQKSIWLTGESIGPLARQFGVMRNDQFSIRLDPPVKHFEWICRIRDVLFSAMTLLFLSPILLLIAILVKLSSAGPAFYKTIAVGIDQHPFVLYKFRSMRVLDKEQDQKTRREKFRIYAEQKQTGKVIDLQRLTGLGAFLRKYILDELPQFWNVLRGNMSLVGPRPCLSYEIDFFPRWALRRFQTRPGLTGIWQVAGRGKVTLEEGLWMDVYQAHARSFSLDFRLILETLRIMLSGQGDQ
jgi:lipopolysaccharide/colanic/teichoic acid biosynthesis glycosyltransferase